MSVAVAKKITVKGVCGTIKLQKLMAGLSDEAIKGPVVPLMTIVGIARRYKVVQNITGESIKFLGNFKATNLETGEITMSGACFLPGAIPDLVFGALGDDADREVQFAFKIGAHFDEKAATKYIYDVESLIPMGETDPLTMLERLISAPVSVDVEAEAEPEVEVKKGPAVKKSRNG